MEVFMNKGNTRLREIQMRTQNPQTFVPYGVTSPSGTNLWD